MPNTWKESQPERFKRVVRALCNWDECPWPHCTCQGSRIDAERAITAWEEIPPTAQ